MSAVCSLFQRPGKSRRGGRKQVALLAATPRDDPRIPRNSLYPPCPTGRDGFAPELPAPPCSLRLQRLGGRYQRQPEKFPRFRGVLAGAPFPFRTRDRGFRTWNVLRPAWFSVARFGGSVSPEYRWPTPGAWFGFAPDSPQRRLRARSPGVPTSGSPPRGGTPAGWIRDQPAWAAETDNPA